MSENRDSALRIQIREGMMVLGMDGDALGRVFEVGDHALALERGAFLPHEWTASFSEVDRVDERGVWLRHGRASMERVSDAFSGPIERYRQAAEDSPIHGWTGFNPPAVSHEESGHPPPSGPEGDRSASPPPRGTDEALISGKKPPFGR
ncbi:MAG TPA: hypothetical protein VFD38_00535 [Myxococcaceae bacterium]|nr:hypothetical protein [Myxococcaceae bacterium]